ncbi:phosphoadenylyl-sulfate reductase [Fodinibius salsisoli]|uniref:Adenosine 5'-phosphosulfate reductase n=1 Tax=Fodinibius salsisoli TaxID=2820877 RepID=A0ABT3PTE1_9BACT|nr:phosphoadenylyl-sulfate reductase [Fodinibius salsisoli]MCW9709133.1 phosphoadenylyl-sulfate reductase [Fodinibius salsisoli]
MYDNTVDLLSEKINYFQKNGRRIFATSSFQTQSIPLLHIISEVCPEISIVFINTGFLFPETYKFKEHVARLLHLNVVEISSETSLHLQKNDEGLHYYSSDTDYCCYLNKVKPLNTWIKKGDVWISGVRRDQSSVRKGMKQIEERENDIIRFHPMLEWTARDIYRHINTFNLPKHPLEDKGYTSIGCVPCTSRGVAATREGRWDGQQKTECGLHTEL